MHDFSEVDIHKRQSIFLSLSDLTTRILKENRPCAQEVNFKRCNSSSHQRIAIIREQIVKPTYLNTFKIFK